MAARGLTIPLARPISSPEGLTSPLFAIMLMIFENTTEIQNNKEGLKWTEKLTPVPYFIPVVGVPSSPSFR